MATVGCWLSTFFKISSLKEIHFGATCPLKSRSNESSNRYFLSYCDVHLSERISEKVKNVGWRLGSVLQLLIGWRQIRMRAYHRLLVVGFKQTQ